MVTKWRLPTDQEVKTALHDEGGHIRDAETVRRINRQIWVKYPSLNIDIKVEEYKAARAECRKFISDNIGSNGIPGRGYDKDATMLWFPPAAQGKISIDLRSANRVPIVTPTSMMFADRHQQKEPLDRTWIELKAGASVARHCRVHNRHFQETENRTVHDYARQVSSAPDHLKQKAQSTFPEHRQRAFDFAS